MDSQQTAIANIIQYLYDNREALSKDKFSGMHKVDDVYRIHKSAFIPHVLDNYAQSNRTIAAVVDTWFGPNKGVTWDAFTLWITIST